MIVAHDVFAETNPGFCAHALVAFTSAFQEVRPQGPEVPLAYLALPIALSGELASTFEKTNRSTALSTWMDRHPRIQVDLERRIDASLELVGEGLQFACFTNALTWRGAHLIRGPTKPKKVEAREYGDGIVGAIKRAERLGYWFATVGSQRAIFNTMGLTL